MLKNHQKELIESINIFLDNILKINKLFKTLLENYFQKNFEEVNKITNEISDLESQCDKIRRDVERKIYQETLIPDLRGDVLGMLENLDKIPGQIQANAHSFNTEKPSVGEELNYNLDQKQLFIIILMAFIMLFFVIYAETLITFINFIYS